MKNVKERTSPITTAFIPYTDNKMFSIFKIVAGDCDTYIANAPLSGVVRFSFPVPPACEPFLRASCEIYISFEWPVDVIVILDNKCMQR